MPSEINIERQIREAIERGDFDNLKGKGKPLDLDGYFSAPEDVRLGFGMLKSNDYVPEEVELFRNIADLKGRLESCEDPDSRIQLAKQLHDLSLSLTLLLERRK